MLSKNQIKLITSLAKKKYRNQHKLFVVEGIKSIQEFLKSEFQLDKLYSTKVDVFNVDKSKYISISEIELKKISFLSTPNTALAIFKIPMSKSINTNQLIVALDSVNDPGNLGTIIRLCDWFGVTDLICNTTTVDCYNPKVVQASMGSITRVNIVYLDLEEFLKSQKGISIFGTFIEGETIYTTNVEDNGILVLGSEANGISSTIKSLISKKLSIPQFGKIKKTESLNVAVATSIILSEFKRRAIEM